MENKKWYENMYFLNRDPDWDAHWLWEGRGRDDTTVESCRKGIEEIFGEYRNPLTDVSLCLFCQCALLPSEAYFWGGQNWPLYKDSDPERAARWKRPYKIFAEHHLDPVQIFIDQTTKNNIRPWASFRMNDCHPQKTPWGLLKEAIEEGQVVGDAYGYYHHCFNFAYPKYRNALRDLIKEVFEKYDFFGLELDFMREPYCYDYKNNPECHTLMTEYIREIKQIMLEAEKRLGHGIKILVRVPSTPSTAMEFGFDVKTWVEEGLVDAVDPSPRWRTSDSGIPVKEWQQSVGHKVPIIPGIEWLNLKLTTHSLEMVKGYLASFYGQGADGAYLYNYFNLSAPGNVWDLTGETCLKGRRQFIVTDQDCFAYPENRYMPLPMTIEGKAELPIEVGMIKPADKVQIIIDFEGDEAPAISAAGKTCGTPVQIAPVLRRIVGKSEDVNLTEHVPLSYDMSGIETPSPLCLAFTGSGTVHYVEIVIDAE